MKAKTLLGAAALIAAAALSSPSWAAETLTDEQMDAVTAGYELGMFQTTILDIANQQYLDTVNILNPGFSWGSDKIYFGPLGGPLFQSNVQVLPNNTPVTVTFAHH